MAGRANTGKSPNSVTMLGQRRELWVDIEKVLGECHVFADMAVAKYTAIRFLD